MGALYAPPPCGSLPFTQKTIRQPIHDNTWLFPTFGCGYPYEIFFLENFCSLWQHFWDTQYKNIFFIFSFNQKNLFTNPSWNTFWISSKIFLENIQKWRFWFQHFWKRSHFDAFSGLAPSKLIFFTTKNKGRLCVYRGIVWYQFQNGLLAPPPYWKWYQTIPLQF